MNQILEIVFKTTFDLAHNQQKLKEVLCDSSRVFWNNRFISYRFPLQSNWTRIVGTFFIKCKLNQDSIAIYSFYPLSILYNIPQRTLTVPILWTSQLKVCREIVENQVKYINIFCAKNAQLCNDQTCEMDNSHSLLKG